MNSAKWLRPIVRKVTGERLAEYQYPQGIDYRLIAWGPLVLLIDSKRKRGAAK